MMIYSYPSTPHWYRSLSVHRDDRYHPDPQYFVGQDVVITEKLDGGVTSIAEHKVYARSSFAPTTEPWFDYMKGRTLPKLYGVPRELCPIGEDLYGVHSIEYDPLPDSFFLFHVLHRREENIGTEKTEGDHFWAWDNVMIFAREYGLLHVPVLFIGKFHSVAEITEWFNEQITQPSRLGPVREGFVMRLRDGFAFEQFGMNVCKFVRANHVQTDEHWSKHWKPAKMMEIANATQP